MNIRRFEASSMAEALAQVKAELGPDAVILHTRSLQRGGIMGMFTREVIEVTASTDVNIQQRRRKAPQQAPQSARRADESGEYAAQKGSQLSEQKARAAAFARQNVIKNTYGRTAGRSGEAAGAVATAAAPAGRSGAEPVSTERAGGYATTRDMAAAFMKEPAFELRNEIAGLRTMVESLLQRTARMAGERTDLPSELAKAYVTLIEQQVAEELAIRVVEDVQRELSAEQLSNACMVRERLTARLAALVPTATAGTVARPVTDGCRSICLIGPTGVGKTTTIAKLAAGFKLRQKQKVGLITIDTYRIAAVDQLRTYANIIGVPLKVVLTPSELTQALREFSDCGTVLIDTAGRSPTDELKLNELAGFMSTAQPTEVHLVLSSTCTQAAMESAVKQFNKVRVDQIIFTKLDEAVSFGVLLNVARKASRALSYITTGQDVPDHVEIGQPRRLARLILGEKL